MTGLRRSPGDLAAEFERRAVQAAVAVDDLEGRDLATASVSRERFAGKRDAFARAAHDLRTVVVEGDDA